MAALWSPPRAFPSSLYKTQHSSPLVLGSYLFKKLDAKGVGVVAASKRGHRRAAQIGPRPGRRLRACAVRSGARSRGGGEGHADANWPLRPPRPRVAGGHVTRRLGAPGAGDAGGQDGGGAGGGQSE